MTTTCNHITLDDLSDECRQIAGIIGLEALIELARARGGEKLYIPKVDQLAIGARNRMICAQFKAGCNYRELARRYNLTETWIREIISEGRSTAGALDKQRQMALFE